MRSERFPEEIRGSICAAGGGEAAFGVCRSADRKEDLLAVFCLASLNVAADLRTVDECGAWEERAVILLVSYVYNGRLAWTCGYLCQECDGDDVYVSI